MIELHSDIEKALNDVQHIQNIVRHNMLTKKLIMLRWRLRKCKYNLPGGQRYRAMIGRSGGRLLRISKRYFFKRKRYEIRIQN